MFGALDHVLMVKEFDSFSYPLFFSGAGLLYPCSSVKY